MKEGYRLVELYMIIEEEVEKRMYFKEIFGEERDVEYDTLI